MQNTEQKQHIKSFGVISVFSMIGLCLLAAYPVMNSKAGENGYKALHRAEGLAYQLVEIHKNLNNPTGGRSIASDDSKDHLSAAKGEIGLDPWGRPYHFEILQRNGKQQKQVAVWSEGENGQSESTKNSFEGDDVGVIVDIR